MTMIVTMENARYTYSKTAFRHTSVCVYLIVMSIRRKLLKKKGRKKKKRQIESAI